MRVYIIGNDGITLCRTTPVAVNDGEIAVASNEELRAAPHGQIVDFPPMNSWPNPVQKPHPPIIVGGAFRLAARRALRYGDGILPAAPSAGSGSPEEFMLHSC